MGYLQLLEGDLKPEERSRYLQVVEERARVLQELITAFYDLSRIEGGEYHLEIQPVDLRRRLEPLLASFMTTSSRRAFRWRWSWRRDCLRCWLIPAESRGYSPIY